MGCPHPSSGSGARLFFRKKILYEVLKKATHKHTNELPTCTFFSHLVRFFDLWVGHARGHVFRWSACPEKTKMVFSPTASPPLQRPTPLSSSPWGVSPAKGGPLNKNFPPLQRPKNASGTQHPPPKHTFLSTPKGVSSTGDHQNSYLPIGATYTKCNCTVVFNSFSAFQRYTPRPRTSPGGGAVAGGSPGGGGVVSLRGVT